MEKKTNKKQTSFKELSKAEAMGFDDKLDK